MGCHVFVQFSLEMESSLTHRTRPFTCKISFKCNQNQAHRLICAYFRFLKISAKKLEEISEITLDKCLLTCSLFMLELVVNQVSLQGKCFSTFLALIRSGGNVIRMFVLHVKLQPRLTFEVHCAYWGIFFVLITDIYITIL